jgi:NAD(P)-dependent dehydrogenase (short-subunit alcohol dehydrogenase family)
MPGLGRNLWSYSAGPGLQIALLGDAGGGLRGTPVVVVGSGRVAGLLQYAKALAGTDILINNACPGYVATDLNGFQGTSTPQEGAAISIKLATLPHDGPTGGLFDAAGVVPW